MFEVLAKARKDAEQEHRFGSSVRFGPLRPHYTPSQLNTFMLTFLQFVCEFLDLSSDKDIPIGGKTADEWGWLTPSGTAILGGKRGGHVDMCGKKGIPYWHEVFYKNFVRFSVGQTGNAMFNFRPTQTTRTAVSKYLRSNYKIIGKIWFDVGSDPGRQHNGKLLDFENADKAINRLRNPLPYEEDTEE
jgi:hypothetical protein